MATIRSKNEPVGLSQYLKQGFPLLISLYVVCFFCYQIKAGMAISFEYIFECSLVTVPCFAVWLALAYPVFCSSHKSLAYSGLAVSLTSLFWGLLLSMCGFWFSLG